MTMQVPGIKARRFGVVLKMVAADQETPLRQDVANILAGMAGRCVPAEARHSPDSTGCRCIDFEPASAARRQEAE
jgi:hypothetical protein